MIFVTIGISYYHKTSKYIWNRKEIKDADVEMRCYKEYRQVKEGVRLPWKYNYIQSPAENFFCTPYF